MALAAISGAAFEIAATEMAVDLHVADHGLDGGATSQFGQLAAMQTDVRYAPTATKSGKCRERR